MFRDGFISSGDIGCMHDTTSNEEPALVMQVQVCGTGRCIMARKAHRKSTGKSRKENPQKLTQLSSRSHSETPRGKKDSTKRHHHRHHKRQVAHKTAYHVKVFFKNWYDFSDDGGTFYTGF